MNVSSSHLFKRDEVLLTEQLYLLSKVRDVEIEGALAFAASKRQAQALGLMPGSGKVFGILLLVASEHFGQFGYSTF